MSFIISFLAFAVLVLLVCVAHLVAANREYAKFAKDTAAAISIIRLAFAQFSRRIGILEGEFEEPRKREDRGVLQ